MESKDWMIIGSGAVIVLLAGIIISQNYATKTYQVTGNSALSEQTFTGDKFDGEITNVKITPGKYVGTGIYDRSCLDVGNGLTNCHGGIKTQEFGVLDFNYVHNMRVKPCIAPGDKVLVTVLDDTGKATVQRAY